MLTGERAGVSDRAITVLREEIAYWDHRASQLRGPGSCTSGGGPVNER